MASNDLGGGQAASAREGAAVDLVAGKTVSQILGEVVWLLSRCADFQRLPLSDLEWLVMPPILLKQFRIHYDGDIPVRFEAWAMTDKAYDFEALKPLLRKDANLWRTGPEKVQVVDAILVKAAS